MLNQEIVLFDWKTWVVGSSFKMRQIMSGFNHVGKDESCALSTCDSQKWGRQDIDVPSTSTGDASDRNASK